MGTTTAREQLAINLRWLMRRFNASDEDISRAINVSKKTVYNIATADETKTDENGEPTAPHNCRIDMVENIARIFFVMPWQMLAPTTYLMNARYDPLPDRGAKRRRRRARWGDDRTGIPDCPLARNPHDFNTSLVSFAPHAGMVTIYSMPFEPPTPPALPAPKDDPPNRDET